MCGIGGVFDLNENQISKDNLIKMGDVLNHRGPDEFGVFQFKNIGLIHRRLSILDLSTSGKQPMKDSSDRYIITFNGEIYNYQELKKDLISEGINFKSKTDTEVLLELYAIYGKNMLSKLNGMFAFAIFDKIKNELFIARDRIGIKPLYWTLQNNKFYFSSEPKGIFAAGVSRLFNTKISKELLLSKYVAGRQTVYKDIYRLLPGHCIKISNTKKISISRWWDLPKIIHKNRSNPIKNPIKWFRETLISSTKYRTISDVPVGVMLSGGLDSSSIAYALSQIDLSNKLNSFNVAFKDKKYDESLLAKEVSEKFNLSFNKIYLEGKSLDKALLDAAYLYDEPLVHHNDPQMLDLSRFAKKKVTVLLSGEGGDELLGGYYRYKPLKYFRFLKFFSLVFSFLKKLPSDGIINRFEKLERYLNLKTIDDAVLCNAFDIYPDDLKKFGYAGPFNQSKYRLELLEEAKSIFPNNPSRQCMYLDMFIHMASVLDRNDKMTMGASIECRVPFLDHRIIENTLSMESCLFNKGKKGKYLLVQSVGKNLPDSVVNFRKLGFSVPWETIFKKSSLFREFYNNDLKNNLLVQTNNLDISIIKKEFESGSQTARYLIRRLFMFTIWQKTCIDPYN